MRRSRTIWPVLGAVSVLLLALGVAACGGDSSSGNGLSLVAYSTPQEAYEEIIPAFNDTRRARA